MDGINDHSHGIRVLISSLAPDEGFGIYVVVLDEVVAAVSSSFADRISKDYDFFTVHEL